MKLVTLDVLFKMPRGTIFQKYEPAIPKSQLLRFIGRIGDSATRPDYQYEPIGFDSLESPWDMNPNDGVSYPTEQDVTCRDACCCQWDDQFLVWEKEDLINAMDVFQKALNNFKESNNETVS